MKKYTIVEITDWEKDSHMMAGDSCHIPESQILARYANEYKTKVEDGNWPNLPFTCEAEDEDEALEKYNETCGRFDYIRAVDCEFEEDETEAEPEQTSGDGKTDWRSWAIHALSLAVDIIQNGEDLTDEEYEAMERDGDTGIGLSYLNEAFQKEDVPQRIVDFIYSIADEGLEMSRQKNLAKNLAK